MRIEIVEIQDNNRIDSYLKNISKPPFLQGSSWGKFQEEIGNKVRSFGVIGSGAMIGLATVIEIKAKFNSFLYVPWGPVLKNWEKESLVKLIDKLIEIAKEKNLDFIRFEPRNIGETGAKLLENLGFKKTKSFTQPECTAVLDLTKSEEELLSNMSDSTRYNVRMVERRGVQVRKGTLSDVKIFEALLKDTAGRYKFTTDIHEGYYRKQYETLNESGVMEILVAEFEKEPLAAALVTFFGDTATYLHAASNRTRSKLRAPYLLLWKSILESKNKGFKYFDFWGVAPENADNSHPWSGVTNFKMSFGAERVCYAPAFDYPITNKYKLVKLVEIARKSLRKILRFS